MMRKGKQTRFVIFFGHEMREDPGARYVAENGSTTTMRLKAATFDTFPDAKDFAEQNHISLDAHTYIGQEDFTDFDLQG